MNIITLLETSGIDSSELDSLVEDSASAMATRVNNLGMEQQLSFLNENYGDHKKVLRYVLAVNSCAPVIITTSGPLGNDSNFSKSFSGKLISLDDTFIKVINESGESIKVLYEEIENFSLSD